MKIFNPFSFQRQVSFNCSGSVDRAINLLSKCVGQPSSDIKLGSGLIGNVRTDKVEIWLHRPNNNFLIPVFIGRFINDGGKTVLIGDFGFPKNTRSAFIFGLVATIAYWIYIAIEDHQRLGVQSQLLLPLWACLATMLFMTAVLYLYRVVSIKDIKNMEQQIRKILSDERV